jgi:hypothetical protein
MEIEFGTTQAPDQLTATPQTIPDHHTSTLVVWFTTLIHFDHATEKEVKHKK